jgi:hypothetical protein
VVADPAQNLLALRHIIVESVVGDCARLTAAERKSAPGLRDDQGHRSSDATEGYLSTFPTPSFSRRWCRRRLGPCPLSGLRGAGARSSVSSSNSAITS